MFFFRLFILFTNSYIYSPPPQTMNNALSQWRMTGSEPKRLGDVEGQRRPTKAHSSHWVANDGQRRPTKMKKGPNDVSGVVWALGMFLFYFIYFILITTRHESPRQPMTANKGQRRPTKANAGQRRPTAANDGQQRPTKTKKGPNNTRHVVWALGVFFSTFFFYFIDKEGP